jgi:thymidylate synthase ThyX
MGKTIRSEVVLHTKYKDSGIEIFTLHLTFPTIILAELNVHSLLAKSTRSLRAVPFKRLVKDATFTPYVFGENCAGMSHKQEIKTKRLSKFLWNAAKYSSVFWATILNEIKVHKQVVNRILSPYMWSETVITGTKLAFENFIRLRNTEFAEPHIRILAQKIKECLEQNVIQLSVEDRDWHIPYILKNEQDLRLTTKLKISAARCARVSYKSFLTNEPSTVEEDLRLFEKLYSNEHLSPMEHQILIGKEIKKINRVFMAEGIFRNSNIFLKFGSLNFRSYLNENRDD